jgi:hypothetical protein
VNLVAGGGFEQHFLCGPLSSPLKSFCLSGRCKRSPSFVVFKIYQQSRRVFYYQFLIRAFRAKYRSVRQAHSGSRNLETLQNNKKAPRLS